MYQEGKFQESADKYRDAFRIYEHHFQVPKGPEEVELSGALQVVAWTLLSRRDYAAAKQACSTALGMSSKLLGAKSITTATNMANLGIALMNSGELYQPEFYFKKAIHIFRLNRNTENFEEMNKNIGMVHLNLGNLYYLRGNDHEAEREYIEMETRFTDNLLPSAEACAAMKNFAAIRWRQGALLSAEKLLAQALMSLRISDQFGVEHPQTIRVQEMLESLRRGNPPPPSPAPKWPKTGSGKNGTGSEEFEESDSTQSKKFKNPGKHK